MARVECLGFGNVEFRVHQNGISARPARGPRTCALGLRNLL